LRNDLTQFLLIFRIDSLTSLFQALGDPRKGEATSLDQLSWSERRRPCENTNPPKAHSSSEISLEAFLILIELSERDLAGFSERSFAFWITEYNYEGTYSMSNTLRRVI